MTQAPAPTAGPGVLDALSLLAEVADELVVRSVRDTHLAVLGRTPAGPVHRGIAGAVYRGLSGGLAGAGRVLDRAAATGVGPRLEADPRGRFVATTQSGGTVALVDLRSGRAVHTFPAVNGRPLASGLEIDSGDFHASQMPPKETGSPSTRATARGVLPPSGSSRHS